MPATLSRSLSILVADDEEGIRALITQWLAQAGHTIECVANGRDASRLLQTKQFDVVITDVVMPEGDGYEVMAAFRKIQPSARIVAISGGGYYLPGSECLRAAKNLGAHAVVMKPFNCAQLFAGIASALPGAFEVRETAAR